MSNVERTWQAALDSVSDSKETKNKDFYISEGVKIGNIMWYCGYQGATDCCIVLTNGKITKEFSVESSSWKKVERWMYGKATVKDMQELLEKDTLEDEWP